MASIPFIDHAVDVPLLLEYPTEALYPILRDLNGWDEVEEDDIECWQISGAMTNIIFRCQNLSTSQYVLVRIFGTNDALFSRDDEQRIFRQVAEVGLGPKLLADFRSGRVEEFLQDQSISAADMRSAPIAYCVAEAMACFHFSPLILSSDGVPPRPIVWDRLRSWAGSVASHYGSKELQTLGIPNMLDEVAALEAALTSSHTNLLGFCHNDLQYGNMLLHTTAHRSLSFDSLRAHSVERAVKGGSPPPVRGGSPLGRRPRGLSPEPEGMSPRSRERLRVALKGFSPAELEPRTSDGELVADLLASAGAEFQRKKSGRGGKPAGSSSGSSPASSIGNPSPLQAVTASRDGVQVPCGRGMSPLEDDSAKSQSLREHAERSGRALGFKRLSVRLIDYEYAGPNPVAFDIANHWCEYAADYHSDSPHLLDYSLLPDQEQQGRFVRAYLESALALQNCKLGQLASSGQEAALDEAAEQLVAAARAYLPVSHLLWGLWGLIQVQTSNVPDFDFASYAHQRLQQYRLLRGWGLALPDDSR